jgi:NAD(P)H-flavin reductase
MLTQRLGSLVVILCGFLIPIALSWIRFVPFPSRWSSTMSAIFNHPAAFGHRHREPLAYGVGLMPTRGQAIFVGYMCLLNILVCAVPYRTNSPNSFFEDSYQQMLCYLADRTGVLSFANLSLMFLYSARNNLLLWVTDWSRTTFLLLHRWIGYIAILQGAVHCLVWLHWYVYFGGHAEQAALPYWYWGIIAILAMCLMYPLSFQGIRQQFYETFLLAHIALTIIVLVGCYLHVWYLFENKWGYEIWIYTAGAVWGIDRIIRVVRIVKNGWRSVQITKIDDDYLRLDIEGVTAHDHVYLYFPTLTWRPWESHPFSVCSGYAGYSKSSRRQSSENSPINSEHITLDPEKRAESTLEVTRIATSTSKETPQHRLTFVLRIRSGITATLATRAGSGIPVLIESSYHSTKKAHDLERCTTLLAIAGGVGISTVLPILRTFPGPRARLCWGVRTDSLPKAIEGEIQCLPGYVEVECSVGKRLDLRALLEEELHGTRGGKDGGRGDVAILVSGPNGMADDVRRIACEIGARGTEARGVVFIDEAFSW